MGDVDNIVAADDGWDREDGGRSEEWLLLPPAVLLIRWLASPPPSLPGSDMLTGVAASYYKMFAVCRFRGGGTLLSLDMLAFRVKGG